MDCFTFYLYDTNRKVLFKWHTFAIIHAKFSGSDVCFPVAEVTLFGCEGKNKLPIGPNEAPRHEYVRRIEGIQPCILDACTS
jgi:hypothetical protein